MMKLDNLFGAPAEDSAGSQDRDIVRSGGASPRICQATRLACPAVLRDEEQMLRQIVAYLNTEGGIVVPYRRNVAPEQTPEKFVEQALVSIAPHAGLELTVQHDGGSRCSIVVRKGSRRPYYLVRHGMRPDGVFWMRDGHVRSADSFEIVGMIEETCGSEYDSMRSLRQDLTFRQAEAVFQSRGVPFDQENWSEIGITDAGDGQFTNLGLLLSDQCPFVTSIAFANGTGAPDENPVVLKGSLWSQLIRLYRILRQYAVDCGAPEVPEDSGPDRVLKTAIAYAVLNQDYTFHSRMHVHVHPSRIEFSLISRLLEHMENKARGKSLAGPGNRGLLNAILMFPCARSVYAAARNEFAAYNLAVRDVYGKEAVHPRLELTKYTARMTLPASWSVQKSIPRRSARASQAE